MPSKFVTENLPQRPTHPPNNGDDLKDVIECAKESKIHIILVHEQDPSEGGCAFDIFFDLTPQDLIDPPLELYKDVALPLCPTKEYRAVSLKKSSRELMNLWMNGDTRQQKLHSTYSSFCNCFE